MKILVCSDIHGNYEALKSIVPYLSDVDMSVCLGDIVGYGCAVNECIDLLRDSGFKCLQGNHERYLIEGIDGKKKFLNESVRFGINIADRIITDANREWLAGLPVSSGYVIDKRKILFVHGSPFDPIDEYVYDNTFDRDRFSCLAYDIVALGHTHREFKQSFDGKIVFNPGSIGQARDFEGKVCFSIIDTESLEITRLRLPYNYESHLDLSSKYGGGEWIYKHFQTIINQK